MLRATAVEKMFQLAKANGYHSCEIYGESNSYCSLDLHGRIEDVRISRSCGVALTCYDQEKQAVRAAYAVDVDALIKQFESPEPTATFPEEAGEETEGFPTTEQINEKVGALTQMARSHWSEHPSLKCPLFQYSDRIKLFEVVTSDGAQASGREEIAEASMHWALENQGKHQPLTSELFSTSIPRLLSQLQTEKPFLKDIKGGLQQLSAWPAPQGEVPVLWSPLAFAKLSLQFLRAFEGDLVLNNLSFLTTEPLPLPIDFTVVENMDSDHPRFDHEGSPRRELKLFEGGKPRAVACDRRIAEQLSVVSTGHCRRESFHVAPTICFWNPKVQGKSRVKDFLSAFNSGIAIHDVEVLKFNPTTGDLRLKLNRMSLVHHGEIGEAIRPLELNVNLLQLLPTLKSFSEETRTIGLAVAKVQQRLITEITAPYAISESLYLPGEVPPSHYW